ncbi:restriction endonuclease subunit R (plasmid) [Hymenobacter sp. DG25B]|uniref:type I restriction endonuclease subunit R n=1 Tax=Hymenobacter sp. DG25B TaxID=1385664 RepID=UPI000540B959|nr:type I restriction endonuclease [Hymenobacter sp. DG25B]AIZ65362.1 restriction endonuclease subunit R [Hymenobacter sp. DG25B]
MASGTQEKDLEQDIENYLLAHGYLQVAPQAYSPELGLVPTEVMAFLQSTQPKAYDALVAQYGPDNTPGQILQRLAKQIQDKGVLPVLREGFKISGQKLRLAYFRPASGLNPEHETLYQQNRFGVMRQVRYATIKKDADNSVDLVLTLNGLPLLTAELKNALTGQYISDAMRQYKEDRNPQEPLFQYRRCLVHFAVSTEQVYMTTKLAGAGTFFLPFNQDVVNPPNPTGFATAYLWEEVWAPDSLLELVQHFVFEQTTEEQVYNDKKGELEMQRSTRLLFPRYHQRRAVRRLLAAVQAEGAGGRYLIKHSAGSGKSNTLSWLAHRLANFYQHPADARPLFDSVIVVTDRRLLNKQLSDNVKGFEQTTGVIFQVQDSTPSAELKQAIEDGRRLILTTLQRFPVISATIAQVPGRRYAVLIDEAHSSQSGESARHLKKALSLEEAAEVEADEPTLEDLVLADIARTGPQPNVSFFAFTATPKPKTIELFGTRQNGKVEPFDEYTMRQAIKEGFILDVLRAYTSLKRYYKLATKAVELDDKEYEKGPVVRLLSQFVDLTDHAIELKTRLMLAHFQQHTQKAIKGRARAMVVTRSRLHAVRYKRKFDEVMQGMGLPYRALVAFSGTVSDPDTGEDYTEVGMNRLDGKASIEAALKLPQFRLLIVANKFQTGFDEPLLHTMYVDKKLGGINTVQTLSRLNRTTRHKDDTLVLDFVNEPAQVQEDFQGYYHRNLMAEEAQTDPNALYDVQDQLMAVPVVREEDLDRFAEIYLQNTDNLHLLQPLLDSCVGRFLALEEDAQNHFRAAAGEYVRLYRFLSQLITFKDVDLAKLYYLLSHLVKKLPAEGSKLPREVLNDVKLDSYKILEQGTQKLGLEEEDGPLQGLTPGGGSSGGSEEVYDYLSAIIKTLNDTFGLELTESDKVDFEVIRTKVEADTDLAGAFKANNSEQNIEAKFSEVLDNALLDFIDTKLELYNKLSEDKANAQMKRLWFKSMLAQRLGGGGTARGAAI